MQCYLSILRPLNCIMAGVAVIIGAMIASTTFFTMPVLFATLAAFLICGAGNVINDYFDYEVDKINNPTRALPSGKISLSRAYAYSILLFFIGILISYTVNVYALMIAVVNSSLLYLYPWKVKGGGGISKNLVVSYLVASPFLFGGVSAGETAEWRATLIFVLLAFFANTAREIIKDIEDIRGDIANTLPKRLGIETSCKIAFLFTLSAVILSPLPYFFGFLNFYYIILVGIADIVFIYTTLSFMHNPTIERAKITQRKIKLGMIFALVAFIVGKL